MIEVPQDLSAWRGAAMGRAVIVRNDGTIRLLWYQAAERFQKEFASAPEAVAWTRKTRLPKATGGEPFLTAARDESLGLRVGPLRVWR